MIPFNRQILLGKELEYIKAAYESGKISGDGKYTEFCSNFLSTWVESPRVLLTTSGSHALEMSCYLLDLKPGDEVIMPSFTFVSTANAFVIRGARPVFCDIREDNLNIDETLIERAINDRTKAIVPVHYGGVACDMDTITKIAIKHDLRVIEDAAHALGAKYRDHMLGSIGDIGCFSFHETKNFSMGEGGAIAINDPSLIDKAEVIREKGTNRKQFFRGEVDKYTWVSEGSSYLPSDINAAILWAQLERADDIQRRRKSICETYDHGLRELKVNNLLRLPVINDFADSSYHCYYLILRSENERDDFLRFLKTHGIYAVFHYVPLHESRFYLEKYGIVHMPVTEDLSRRLVRLPLFFGLDDKDVTYIIDTVKRYFV